MNLVLDATDEGKIYASEKTESKVFSFEIKDSAFVSLHNPLSKSGCAFYLSFANLGSAAFRKLLQDSLKQLKTDEKNAIVKVIAPAQHIARLKNDLAGFTSSQVTTKETNSSEFQLYFYPNENRIRLLQSEKQKPIRVLIVDDSSTIRKVLKNLLSKDPTIEVVAEAGLPSQVDALIQQHKPDVITMDIHMPEMDGVQLLKILMPKYSIPTVMVTALSMEDGPLVLDALANGAVDYLQKPGKDDFATAGDVIIEKVKSAAKAKNIRAIPNFIGQKVSGSEFFDTNQLIAIGSSTGGTEALRVVLQNLPKNIPPILIVQHIPPVFSKALAERLNTLCDFEVKEAQEGDIVQPGRVLIAPGGKQMKIKRVGSECKIIITDEAPVNRHKPSVDVLFQSVAKEWRGKSIGVILTGMGSDGAKGLLEMKQANSATIAQNEESCVVYGMPREAVKLGAADKVIHLNQIAKHLGELLNRNSKKSA